MSERKKIFVKNSISPQFIADAIAKHAAKKNIGAHSIFLGQVRNDIYNDKEVIAIDYETYEEMANDIAHEIREEMFKKYSLTCMHIYHSMGRVETGEISLFVFTSSKHRADAQKACHEIVERIKSDLPVWGKEQLSDQSYVPKQSNY